MDFKNLDYEQFKFVILPGSYPEANYKSYYDSAYSCWRGVWEEAYSELGLNKVLYSDDFTRQTEIGCVFYANECVGMLFFNYADLSICDFRRDSYFKNWNDEDIKKLTRDGTKILICSNTTIAKSWRKKNDYDISMKDLLLYMLCKRFKNSGADAMTGVTRRNRGIHKLTYRFGAVPIREDIANFNDSDRVDLCAFYKNTVSEGQNEAVIKLGRLMWKNRVFVPRSLFYLPEADEKLSAYKLAGKVAA